MNLRLRSFGGLVADTRDRRVTDEAATSCLARVFRGLSALKIEHAHAPPRFATISSSVTRADHHTLTAPFFRPKINHTVSHRRIALDRVSARPEKQITRLQRIELEALLLL